MQRFVSKRSSSSVDLASSSASSSLDDVRAERAAIALFFWSELATSQTAAVRRKLQLATALGTCSLQEHILLHHGALAWSPLTAVGLVATGRDHRPTAHTRGDRPHQHSLYRPVGDEPCGSGSKASHNRHRRHRARLVPRHVGPVEDRTAMEHASVLVRGPNGCAPGCSTGSTGTLRTAGNRSAPRAAPLGRKTLLSPADMTRRSEHIMRVTDVLCLSAVTVRRLVHEWLDAEDSTSVPASGGADSFCVACA